MSKMSLSEAGRRGAEKTNLARRLKYETDPRQCVHCGNTLPYESKHNKFCNRSCAASHNNTGVARNVTLGEYRRTSCPVCGKESRFTFCSRACWQEHKWRETCRAIESQGSLIATDYGYGYNPHIAKRYLTQVRGHRCEICGETEWCGQPIPLVLDHASGDPTDHSLTNVRLVCGNCNMLLPTFAGKNRGNGRRNRKAIFG